MKLEHFIYKKKENGLKTKIKDNDILRLQENMGNSGGVGKAGQLHILTNEIRTLHIQKENGLKTKIKDIIKLPRNHGKTFCHKL